MNTIYNKIGILAAASALLLSAGCMQLELNDPAMDENIVFGASTEYENDAVETRTEYSGQILGSTTKYERINWIAGQDQFRVYCNEATNVDAHYLDYTIGTVSTQSEKSQATVTGASGVFKWNNDITDHYFYALYPSPEKNTSGSISVGTNQKATISGSIPATQTGEWVASTRTYKPNMNYAYMYAAKKQSKGTNPTPESTHVTLEFKPLVTAMEFSIVADNTFPITSALTKAELISSTTNLAGNFTASLDASTSTGLSGNPSVTGGTKTLTISFPSGVTLSKTAATTFTFLALPVEQKNLTLRLTFASGETRSLVLATSGGNISVGARKKLYIRSLGVVPNVTYRFSVTADNNLIIPASPGSGDRYPFSVTSFADFDGQSKPIGWTASFSLDNGATWSSTKPSWISSIPTSGSGSSENKASLGNNTTSVGWAGSTSSIGSQSQPVDLSKRTIFGETLSTRSTANCYVISAPGWYKIPVVYGNAIKNGSTNTVSFYNGRSGSNIMSRFLNHNNSGIQQPWIEDNGISISDAILCWQDWSNGPISNVGLITDSETNKKFIRFRVNGLSSGGNALIAARSNGTIVWSWHIWIIPQSQLYTMGVKSQNGDTYQMLSVNLGWYGSSIPLREVLVRITQEGSGNYEEFIIHQDNGTDILFGGNTYYQWGRKDPMLGFTTGFTQKTQSGSQQFKVETIHWTEKDRFLGIPRGIKSVDTTIGDAIKNPNVFYSSPGQVTVKYGINYNFSMFDWVQHRWYNNTRYDNLWNADGSYDTAHNQDTRVVKTVYDPCPVGFKIPSAGAFYSVRVHKYVQGKGQWYYPSTTDPRGLLFPATSLRELEDGTVRKGYEGVYMYTAGHEPHRNNNFPQGVYYEGRNESVSSTRSAYGGDAFGFSVRPIAE